MSFDFHNSTVNEAKQRLYIVYLDNIKDTIKLFY